MHASHNLFFQDIFNRLTIEEPSTWYFVDEFGAISALVAVVVAIIFWSKRKELQQSQNY